VLAPLTDDDPRQIGPYQLQNRIGAGGMGAVYLGFGPDREPVAVKVPTPALARDPEFRARFRTEVEAARRVRGLSVAAVIDADVNSATPWMATEYVEGRNLAAAVAARGALDGRLVHGLAVGLADALVAIHAAGVVHRDLKPSNILLSWDGPKVIDFGVARATDASSHTRTGTLIGTLVWMAPEQLRGERAGTAADIFAWGACVAFAATGRPPFRGERPEAAALQIMTIEPDLDGAPDDLVPILRHAMEKEPSRRPSAADLVERLVGSPVSSTLDSDDAASTALASWWSLTPPGDLPPGAQGTPPGGAGAGAVGSSRPGSAVPPTNTPGARRPYERQAFQRPDSDPRAGAPYRAGPAGGDQYGGSRDGHGYDDQRGYAGDRDHSDQRAFAGAAPDAPDAPRAAPPDQAGSQRRTSRGAVIVIAAGAALLLGGGVAGAVILANNSGGHAPDTLTSSSSRPTVSATSANPIITASAGPSGGSGFAAPTGPVSASASASASPTATASPTSNSQLTLAQAKQMVAKQYSYTIDEAGSWAPANSITVLVGHDPNDTHKQLAFFFANGGVIGTDTTAPSAHISVSDYTNTTVTLTYATYATYDSLDSPSSSQNVTYTWNGSKLTVHDADIPPDNPSANGSRR
jgi:serine/threonine protein kinase